MRGGLCDQSPRKTVRAIKQVDQDKVLEALAARARFDMEKAVVKIETSLGAVEVLISDVSVQHWGFGFGGVENKPNGERVLCKNHPDWTPSVTAWIREDGDGEKYCVLEAKAFRA